jgi:hypothetical protein
MSTEDPESTSVDQPREHVVEGAEAEGVETIEATTELAPDQAADLDARTLADVDDEQRADLQTDARSERSVAVGASDDGEVRLSANFVLAEFHCKDGTHVPAQAMRGLRRLVRNQLQPMREKFGSCNVNSAYRTKSHNARVGGEPNSQHRYELGPESVAADVRFAQGSPREWAAEAERLLGNSGGIGTYRTFVHVDNRGKRGRW